ncbi:MAG: nitrate ABC transporter substrate-binding protein, partial [Pseudomonadota bacterium]
VLTGTYADGLGNIKKDPNRVTFEPFPYDSFAIWILTQMKRWGQVKGDVDYAGIAKQVFLATECAAVMKDMGLTPPAPTKTIVVMGKPFDPAKPDAYVESFAIKRT